MHSIAFEKIHERRKKKHVDALTDGRTSDGGDAVMWADVCSSKNRVDELASLTSTQLSCSVIRENRTNES